ncbi:F-box/kelch-repeat protein At3g23880-like isoform X2 [Quercus robur]|uniref:F-box/kelch-repeat protein At3g23880-like isoform X2 n=1 Tax=Quercus robur TaxID=38942 RepID=UPI0021634D35|nr:F-box/kelch-repeat protein At3g23880-like isoform X2 [Quercus robur]XP_050272768.1 F-box/kelch-repeat protein At3g23880-like isoform X2 [Quercus robur]
MRICKARRQSFTIPNDLVEDILSRLPVKSLMRFKCVSKAWHTLISSRRFAKSHFQRASQNPSCMNVIVFTDNCVLSLGYEALFQTCVHGQPVDVDFQGFPLWGEEYVETNLASCNGLVCIELYNRRKRTSEYLVWNPSTKSYKNIPRPTSTPDSMSCWFYRFGFGYDYSTDDHKIVRPFQIFPFDIKRIEIFSLKTFTWKTILVDVDNIYNCSLPLIPKTTYCNGAIYWSARKYGKPSIVYFDLAEEIFHELPWPESVLYCIRDKSSGKCFYTTGLWELGTFGEHLCLSVCTGESRKNLCIQLWVMKESWTRLATIPYLGTCLRPMCVSKNGEKVLMRETQVKYVGITGEWYYKLVEWNLTDHTCTSILCDPNPRMEAATYVESLYLQ